MRDDYEDVTDSYSRYERVSLEQLPLGSDLVIGDLIKTPDGRIIVPQAGPHEANLFAVYSKVDGRQVLVAEFPTIGEAESFLDEGEEKGYLPLRWGDVLSPAGWERNFALKALVWPWVGPQLAAEGITLHEDEEGAG